MNRLKKYLRNSTKLALVTSLFVFFSSCILKKPSFEKDRLEQKIKNIINKDLGIKTVSKQVGKTLYIYIPVEKTVVRLIRSKKDSNPPSVFDSFYKDEIFILKYTDKNLPPQRKFFKNITTYFTDYMQSTQQRIMNILYGAINDISDDIDFFVIYISDISGGIEVKQTIFVKDLKRSAAGALPWMEFNKRVLIESIGDKKIIGDRLGEHLDYEEIKLGDFISDLLIYNLFQSEKPKGQKVSDYAQEVFYQIVKDYKFNDYKYLLLEDVVSEKDKIIYPFELNETATNSPE
ncbi:MAG: hypothetical protein R6U54_02145 [Candidatus Omnitrophota bacterium]